MVLPVGYSEVMFLCMPFFVASSTGPRPAFRCFQKAGRGPGNESTFIDCKGYRVVPDSAVFNISGMTFLTWPKLIPSLPL